MIFKPAFIFAVLTMMILAMSRFDAEAMAQERIAEPGLGDPSRNRFEMMDPATQSLSATKQLSERFQDQQHRFQPSSDRRQLRTKRPEPGEMEVNREEAMILPDTGRQWRSRQPQAALSDRPRRAPYHPSPLQLPGTANPVR